MSRFRRCIGNGPDGRLRAPRALLLGATCLLVPLAVACDSGSIGHENKDGGVAEQGADYGWNADSWSGDFTVPDAEICAQSSMSATVETKPIDIIIVIDNSGSMDDEIEEVEEQINANFANIINAANPPIDYRVIMLSQFGAYSSRRICVAEPLGGIADANHDGHCDTLPGAPVNTSKFFHHAATISSHNGLCQIIGQLTIGDAYGLQPNGYGEVLRPDAFKFILMVTDDGVDCGSYDDDDKADDGWTAADAFDSFLLANYPEHFGSSPDTRNYTFWSIVALAPYQPAAGKPYGVPHPPDETAAPLITGECTPSAVAPGTGYQALSIKTGGYRYPTCGLEYTDIFQLMAQGVILGARVPCEYEIPEPPEDETLDLETVQVRYSSDGQEVEVFDQTPTEESCAEDKHQFYIDGDHIRLCPNTCDLVQADDKASIDILYGCELGGID